jgi:hypothetical protein
LVVRRALIVTAAVALATGGALVLGASAGADAVLQKFDEVGAHQWTVPANVCSITVEVWGAEGGDGALGTFIFASSTGVNDDGVNAADSDTEIADPGDASGGKGGYASATIPVTPGETLTVNVGEQGGDAKGATGGEGGESAAGDGGEGGDSTNPNGKGVRKGGGGGGGASSVARGDEQLVIAGGGGGGGGGANNVAPNTGTAGGDGGGEGENGATITRAGSPFPGAEGGEAGGDGGTGGNGAGGAGTQTRGGDGDHHDGGEGGDGAFQGAGGGGGGATGGGGGGGVGSNALVGGGGGGGGSGAGPGGTHFENGENGGDGHVTIRDDPAAGCVAPVVAEPRFTG